MKRRDENTMSKTLAIMNRVGEEIFDSADNSADGISGESLRKASALATVALAPSAVA